MTKVTRDEFEALKERVAQLENAVNSDSVDATPDGLDHRDKRVLDYMSEHEPVDGIQLTKLYTSLTDITTNSTAANRAKQLSKHPAYKELYE